MIFAARHRSYRRFDSSPVASGCSRSCSMMKRSIVMTSEPCTVAVRGESDRAALVGREHRDSVRRKAREHVRRGVTGAVGPPHAGAPPTLCPWRETRGTAAAAAAPPARAPARDRTLPPPRACRRGDRRRRGSPPPRPRGPRLGAARTGPRYVGRRRTPGYGGRHPLQSTYCGACVTLLRHLAPRREKILSGKYMRRG